VLNRDIAPLGRAGRRLLEAGFEDKGMLSIIEEIRLELHEIAESLT
jgi:hypothetical protein